MPGSLTTAARAAFNAAEVARQAARAATQNFYDKVRAMHLSAGADMIDTPPLDATPPPLPGRVR